MTRRERQSQNQKYCDRVTRLIKTLHYFPDDIHLMVQLGGPTIRRFRVTNGQVRHRMRGRGILLIVQHDWIEDVFDKNMAIIHDNSDRSLLVLALNPQDPHEGQETYYVEFAYQATNGGLCHDHGWIVRFGGTNWYSDSGPQHAFSRACGIIEKKLNGEEELPSRDAGRMGAVSASTVARTAPGMQMLGVPASNQFRPDAVSQQFMATTQVIVPKRINTHGTIK